MAINTRLSFKGQMESLSGVSIGTTDIPYDAAAKYILDGFKDVAKKVRKEIPTDIDLFTVTDEITSVPHEVSSGAIINVRRKVGSFGNDQGSTVDDIRSATKTSVGNFSRTQDTSSLLYQSKYNSVYIVNRDSNADSSNVVIDISPAPTTSEPAFITYIDMEPKGSADGFNYSSLDVLAHSYLYNLPEQYVQAVVMYAAIKSIEKKLSVLVLDEEDVELEESFRKRREDLLSEYDSFLNVGGQARAQAQAQAAEKAPRRR